MPVVLAVDAGTTGVRALAVDGNGEPVALAYRELTQFHPRPGEVEHDPEEIVAGVAACLAEVAEALRQRSAGPVAALGVTNQRETVVAWDRASGVPYHRAIVWSDRRTAPRCAALRAAGAEAGIRRATGLVLDPYFSATKMEWLLRAGGVPADAPGLCLGTVDAWVAWNLTGGPDGGAFVTDPGNAARTMLFDIRTLRWSDELCDLFGVPQGALAGLRPSSGRIALTDPARAGGLAVPLSGLCGDQQAALFGQGCFSPGEAKVTFGTGSFVLATLGPEPPAERPDGLLTTVAWTLGDGATTWALEGAVLSAGSAIGWLRDGLGVIASAAECGPLAASVADSGGVVLVPAFTGLGSPYWDPHARGALLGLSFTTTRAHLARAAVDALAHQTRDVVDAMCVDPGVRARAGLVRLAADGGASRMDGLCQLTADLTGVPVARCATVEATALGAAGLAGLAEGVWDLPALAARRRPDAEFTPTMRRAEADRRHAVWRNAVERVLDHAAKLADAGDGGPP